MLNIVFIFLILSNFKIDIGISRRLLTLLVIYPVQSAISSR